MPKIILAEMPRECGFNFSKCFVGGFEKMLVGKKKNGWKDAASTDKKFSAINNHNLSSESKCV